ncbi:MAG: heme NO-binding domain-containing protein [Alphaproteobacteria bacterium]
MKGIIFTEFLEMVEEENSSAFLEDVIAAAKLGSGGAYTAVGNYPCEELLKLVRLVSTKTNTTEAILLKRFGERIFMTFCERFHGLIHHSHSSYNLFEQVEHTIHREVKKLYPDAECPTFELERQSPLRYSLIYNSPKPLGDLCEGIINAVLKYHGEKVILVRTTLQSSPITRIRFDFTIQGGRDGRS